MADFKDRLTWDDEDAYWRGNWRTRPYAASGGSDYDYYRPAYRYGVESAGRYADRDWNEVESDLRSNWNTYEHRGESTWEQMKDAVRDAWDRVTGHRSAPVRR